MNAFYELKKTGKIYAGELKKAAKGKDDFLIRFFDNGLQQLEFIKRDTSDFNNKQVVEIVIDCEINLNFGGAKYSVYSDVLGLAYHSNIRALLALAKDTDEIQFYARNNASENDKQENKQAAELLARITRRTKSGKLAFCEEIVLLREKWQL